MHAVLSMRRFAPIAGMTVTHAVDDLYQGAVPALIPFLVAERHYNYAAASGITLAATVLSSVTQPAFGILTDRRRMAWLVPAGVTCAGVGVGLAGLNSSYALTWLAVALSGLGVAAYHPEASRAARTASGGSARGMSWFALGGNIGFVLGPLLATPMLIAGGVRATPLLAVPALVTAAVLVVLRRTTGATPAQAATAAARAASGHTDDWRAFRRLTGVVVCRSICFFAMTSFLALYLAHQLGVTPAEGNAALTAFLAAGAVGTLLGGWLADRYGRVPAVRTGYALALPGLGGLLVAPNAAVAYCAVAVAGIALYIPFSVHVTLGQEYLPNRIGTASGVTLGLAVSVGGVVAPALGMLADAIGLRSTLAVLLALPIAALLVSYQLPDSRHHMQTSTGPEPDTSAAGASRRN